MNGLPSFPLNLLKLTCHMLGIEITKLIRIETKKLQGSEVRNLFEIKYKDFVALWCVGSKRVRKEIP